MADYLKNFAYSTVATAPSPATSGTSLVVASGNGSLFPSVPFNAVIWPTSANPLSTNAEVVRVTAIASDTLTITRAQEGTSARTVVIGDQIAAVITAQVVGQGYVNRIPTYDQKVPAGHSVVISDDFEIGASVDVELDADGNMEIL